MQQAVAAVVAPQAAGTDPARPERVLRNEPKAAAVVKGPHGGSKLPKGWDNSRRARRARQALERANGSHEIAKARQSGWAGGQEFDWGLGKTERIQRITGGCGPSPPRPPLFKGGKVRGSARGWAGGRPPPTLHGGNPADHWRVRPSPPPGPPFARGGKCGWGLRVGLSGFRGFRRRPR